jgi:hypothetical protein
MNGVNMFGVHLRKTWLDLGRYFGSQFLLSCHLQWEYEQWMGNFCSFSYRHTNSRYSTTVLWRRLPVITWPRYRKIACALCKLLRVKEQELKLFQSLSIVVAFFPLFSPCARQYFLLLHSCSLWWKMGCLLNVQKAVYIVQETWL